MKKKPPFKMDLRMLTPESRKIKMDSTTSQVILAAVAVLIVFLVALMSSMPRKEAMPAGQIAPGQEVRSGTQTAQITVLRDGQTAETAAPVPATPPSGQTPFKALIANNAAAGTAAQGASVKFKIDTFKKLATQPLKFNIYDGKGIELTPDWLQTKDEQKVHLLVVSANLREYQHLNPSYENGTWNASAYLPTPGTYYAFIDIDPIKGSPAVIRNNLTVKEASKGTPKFPGLTPDLYAITDGVRASLTMSAATVGKDATLSYQLAKDGKVVTDIRPYTGAFGYVVIFNQAMTAGYTTARAGSDAAGNISFSAKLQSAGRYTAFAEFNVAGKVLLFPITFDIK
jgi:hypothetical protein